MSFKQNSFLQGGGIPLVFQHGLTANINQIISLLGGLDGVALSGIDCPGHGLSDLGDFNPSFDNYTDQVIDYMDYQGLDHVIMGGLSMGSGIALNTSLRYPDRVRALILHRPAWLDILDPQNLVILKEACPYISQSDGADLFRTTSSFMEIDRDLPQAAKSVMGIFSPTQQSGLPKVISGMVGDKPFDKIVNLNTINVPCLIIGNDDDPLHPFEMAQIIHDNINGSILKKVTSRYIDADLHRMQVRENILNFIQQLL